MKRTTIVGVCALLALALAGVLASSALAASEIAPEYGQCVVMKKGKYSDANCQNKVTKKGTHEWVPGPPRNCIEKKDGDYSDAACTKLDKKNGKGKGKYEHASCNPNCDKFHTTVSDPRFDMPLFGQPWECTGGEGEGEIISATQTVQKATFKHCVWETRPCYNVVTGDLETKSLETYLIGHEGTNPPGFGSEKPVAGEVWTQYSGIGGASSYIAEFQCGPVLLRTFGWHDAFASPQDKMQSMSTSGFSESIGEQGALLTEANAGSGWSAPGKTTEYATESSEMDYPGEKVELRLHD